AKALREYSKTDQDQKPVGRDVDDAITLTLSLVDTLRGMLAGYDWKTDLAKPGPKRYLNAVTGSVNYLRDVATPGNQVEE
ncbi:DUF3387 domain-containing protein, partial [Microbacterium sp. ER1]